MPAKSRNPAGPGPHSAIAFHGAREGTPKFRDERVGVMLRESTQYCDVRLVAEFDDPDWLVEPK
jgi:hypothetical protein